MKLDLNCDLGESEPLARTRGLMRWITSASVACGGHAGNVQTMAACARLAREAGIRIGAHPGTWDRDNFGRDPGGITGDRLELLLLHQVSALERIVRVEGYRLHHVKLHGALYHAVDLDESLAKAYVHTVARWWPKIRLYARAGGRVSKVARAAGLSVWDEVFLDRGYLKDGTLAPRSRPRAMLLDLGGMRDRLRSIVFHHQIHALTGETVSIRPQTLCLHGDAPRAVARAAAARTLLRSIERAD